LKVYIISLIESSRRSSIAKSFDDNAAEFTFVDAIDMRGVTPKQLDGFCDQAAAIERYGRELTPAEVGCYLSHVSVWQAIAKRDTGAIVLEDDALLDREFFEQVLCWDEVALSAVADIILLGRSKTGRSSARKISISEPLKNWETIGELRVGYPFKQWTSGAVGYWISASAAQQMASNHAGRMRALVDDWPFHRDQFAMRIAETRPYVVWEAFETMPSSIEPERRLVTRKRAWLHEVMLRPLRTIRTLLRWMRVAGRVMTGRTGCSPAKRFS
jgi:glycosyl transferase, family 25